jgi:hypothetical protein
METLSYEKQIAGYMEGGKTVPAGYGLDTYVQSLTTVRNMCSEYQNKEGGAGAGTSRFSSWRGGGGGGSERFPKSQGGHGQHGQHGQHGNHGQHSNQRGNDNSNKGHVSNPVVVPIQAVGMRTGPISNAKGAWSNAVKKNGGDQMQSQAQMQAQTQSQTPGQDQAQAQAQGQDKTQSQGMYKLPSSHRGGNFNKSKEEVESKILNNMILGKLNKFTKENYDGIKQFLEQILSNDETEFLKDFMVLIFKKATREKIYCPLYVRLIAELSAKYPIIKDELFARYDAYTKEFETIEEDQSRDDYDEFCATQSEKLYRLGYGQFLAELTRQGVLDAAALNRMYELLLSIVNRYGGPGSNHKNQLEEMCACMSSMTQAFQKEKNPALIAIRNLVAQKTKSTMEDIVRRSKAGELPGMTIKARFALMDCLDIFVE